MNKIWVMLFLAIMLFAIPVSMGCIIKSPVEQGEENGNGQIGDQETNLDPCEADPSLPECQVNMCQNYCYEDPRLPECQGCHTENGKINECPSQCAPDSNGEVPDTPDCEKCIDMRDFGVVNTQDTEDASEEENVEYYDNKPCPDMCYDDPSQDVCQGCYDVNDPNLINLCPPQCAPYPDGSIPDLPDCNECVVRSNSENQNNEDQICPTICDQDPSLPECEQCDNLNPCAAKDCPEGFTCMAYENKGYCVQPCETDDSCIDMSDKTYDFCQEGVCLHVPLQVGYFRVEQDEHIPASANYDERLLVYASVTPDVDALNDYLKHVFESSEYDFEDHLRVYERLYDEYDSDDYLLDATRTGFIDDGLAITAVTDDVCTADGDVIVKVRFEGNGFKTQWARAGRAELNHECDECNVDLECLDLAEEDNTHSTSFTAECINEVSRDVVTFEVRQIGWEPYFNDDDCEVIWVPKFKLVSELDGTWVRITLGFTSPDNGDSVNAKISPNLVDAAMGDGDVSYSYELDDGDDLIEEIFYIVPGDIQSQRDDQITFDCEFQAASYDSSSVSFDLEDYPIEEDCGTR